MSAVEQSYSNPHHQYETIDYVSNYNNRRLHKTFALCVLYCSILAAGIISLMFLQGGASRGMNRHVQQQTATVHKIMHITDPHIDVYFDPEESVPKGGCHSCALATFNSSSPLPTNKLLKCPSEKDVKLHLAKTSFSHAQSKYVFGRYGCDPPLLLWTSLLAAMQHEDSSPPVVVFTGEFAEVN
jgi:hypothetical protein